MKTLAVYRKLALLTAALWAAAPAHSQTLDPSFRPSEVRTLAGAAGAVRALALLPDGRIIVAGDFADINGWRSFNVARLLPNGDPDLTFQSPGPVSGGLIHTVAVDASGQVILGGTFTSVAGQPCPALARLTATGAFDPSLQPRFQASSPTPRVQALLVQSDGKLLVGGSFTAVASTGAVLPNLIRLHPGGTIDQAYVPAMPYSGQIGALLLQPNGALLAAGNIFFLNGLELVRRFLPGGALDPSFRIVEADRTSGGIGTSLMPAPGGGFFLGGMFIRSNNQFAASVARLHDDGTTNSSFVSALPINVSNRVSVNTLAVEPGGAVVAGGQLAGNQSPHLERLLPTGQIDPSYFGPGVPGPNAEVFALLRQPDGMLLVGGQFGQIAGAFQPGIARLLAPLSLALRPAGLPAPQAWPNPVAAGRPLHVALAAGARQVQLLDLLGRVVLSRPQPPASLTLELAALPAGIYQLRADYPSGPVARRVVVE